MIRSVLPLAALLSSLSVSALSVSTTVFSHSICGRPTGYAVAYASGGLPPYTYSWDNGSTEQMIDSLYAGTYTITVTDANSDQAVEVVVIDALIAYPDYSLNPYGIQYSYCSGDPAPIVIWSGQMSVGESPSEYSLYGPAPYQFNAPELAFYTQASSCLDAFAPVYNMLYFNEPPGSQIMVSYQDGAGCPGQVQVSIPPPLVPPQLQIVGVGGTCTNADVGSVTLSVSGGNGQTFGGYARRVGQAGCPAFNFPGFVYDWATEDGLVTLTGLSAGDHYLVWTTDPLSLLEYGPYIDYICTDSMLFTVPEVAADCGSLSGRLYVDDDADCVMDGNETRIPWSIVTVEPGPYYLMTDGQGRYGATLPYSSYTVNEQHPVFVQSCPAAANIVSPAPQTANVGCAGGAPLDVMVSMGNGPIRPGFDLGYGLQVRNLTATGPGTLTLTFEFDPVLTFLSAYPPPTSVIGNVVTWTDPVLTLPNVFDVEYLGVHLQVPNDQALIGTALSATATVTTTNTDADLANNVFVSSTVVTASLDPNDKVAATSTRISDSQYLIDQDEWIDYTIRFQNTGTDTAFNVLLTDTFPSTLDPGSLLMGASSHPYTWELTPFGVLRVVFNNILLPDSNVNEWASHGFVQFRIRPHLPLTVGTLIANTANIYFDFNPAVITEPSLLVAEMSTGVEEHSLDQLQLYPDPAHDRINLAAPADMRSVRIIAMDGRTVLSKRLTGQWEELAIELPAGTYCAHVRLADGSSLRKLFVVH
jgi:uncharacterized repeat protein (TIGR01451 family)